VSKPTCRATRKDGATCRAPALPDSALCWTHDPRQAEAAARARAAGAAKGGRLRALRERRAKLDTAAALLRFNAGVIQDTLAGTLPPDVARAVLYGVSIQRQLVEAGDLERRVEALEARLTAQKEQGGDRRWRA
jgi:hypothetical protein